MKTKTFNDLFFDKLADDPLLALTSICQEFRKLDNEANQKPEFLEDYLEALAIFSAKAASTDYSMKPHAPNPASNSKDNINNIRAFFEQNESELTRQLNTVYLERQTSKYVDRFNSGATYEFSDEDFSRIQVLINEMRDIMTASQVITAKHRHRLLERLERLQRELHKTTSDLDRFWGLIGEAGIALGQFGNDVKPLVDRLNELTNIVWRTIRIKERLLDAPPPISLPEARDNTGAA